ncbi:aaa domain protein [Cystoisospora suis]|uniref:Aaa domain protein n=1 Tax=Cystoisospora suis TaxID=483139 RepID=A0A2C6KJE0_9APIC|nr:aaa domain protein [Cystoisospora suis]
MPRAPLHATSSALPLNPASSSQDSCSHSQTSRQNIPKKPLVICSDVRPVPGDSRARKRREPSSLEVVGHHTHHTEDRRTPRNQADISEGKRRKEGVAPTHRRQCPCTSVVEGTLDVSSNVLPSWSTSPVSSGHKRSNVGRGGQHAEHHTGPLTRQRLKEASQKGLASNSDTKAEKASVLRSQEAAANAFEDKVELTPNIVAKGRRKKGELAASRCLESDDVAHNSASGVSLAEGEREVEMTSPPKVRREADSETDDDLEGSDSGVEANAPLELQSVETEIEKFETALTLLRPTLGDYAGEREDSVQAIEAHINKLLSRKKGGMIYLCGASGTGKTCTAMHVLQQKLRDPKHRGKVHKDLVNIKCAHREKDAQLFVEMLVRMLPPSCETSEKALHGELKSAIIRDGIAGLVTRFTRLTEKSDKLWLCLVDEVDFLTTAGKTRTDVLTGGGRNLCGGGRTAGGHGHAAQRQDVLMALALAAVHPQSKIIVVAISNSSELAQHFAGLPIPSLTFCPYTEKQLTSLLLKRLEALGGQQCFAAPAILLFARKAANTYGDFRLALSGFCRAIEDKLNALHEERTAALLSGVSSRPRPGISSCSTAVPLSRSTTAESSSSFEPSHASHLTSSYRSRSGSSSFDRSFSPLSPSTLQRATYSKGWAETAPQASRGSSPTPDDKGDIMSVEVAFSSSSPVGEHLRESPRLGKGVKRGQCAAVGDESPGNSVSCTPCSSREDSGQEGSAAVLGFSSSPADGILALRSHGQKAPTGILPGQACLPELYSESQDGQSRKTNAYAGSPAEGDLNVKSTHTSDNNKPTQACHLQSLPDDMTCQQHATPSTVASSLTSSPLASTHGHGGTSKTLTQGSAVSCRKKPPELSQKCVLGEDLHSALRRKLESAEPLSRAEMSFSEVDARDEVCSASFFGKVTATSPVTAAGLAGHYGGVAGYGDTPHARDLPDTPGSIGVLTLPSAANTPHNALGSPLAAFTPPAVVSSPLANSPSMESHGAELPHLHSVSDSFSAEAKETEEAATSDMERQADIENLERGRLTVGTEPRAEIYRVDQGGDEVFPSDVLTVRHCSQSADRATSERGSSQGESLIFVSQREALAAHSTASSPARRIMRNGERNCLLRSTSVPSSDFGGAASSCTAASFLCSSPPATPFPSAGGAASGHRNRSLAHRPHAPRQPHLSALKLLQFQKEQTPFSEKSTSHCRLSSSSSNCSSSRRSVELRDVRNFSPGPGTTPLNHFFLSAGGRANREVAVVSAGPQDVGGTQGHCRATSASIVGGDERRREADGGSNAHGQNPATLARKARSSVRGATGGTSVQRGVTEEVIGVGALNARAGTVFGNEQQSVVARIQGLPLMHQVYLLAACRSAMKRVHESPPKKEAAGRGKEEARQLVERRASGARGSHQENVALQHQHLAGCVGSVDITFEDVEVGKSPSRSPSPFHFALVQYRQLCQELQNGHFLNENMATSCWRHALEAFEQMGLMRPKHIMGCGLEKRTSSSGCSSSLLKGPWSAGSVARGAYDSFPPFGGGRRSSAGSLWTSGSSSGGGRWSAGSFRAQRAAEKEQAWELQLSPPLIEAAIKRLQPILMSSDLEEHFTRGLEA